MSRFATHEECFMMKEGDAWGCTGGINMFDNRGNITCGPDCPFRKTEEEQRAIEAKIVERFRSGKAFVAKPYVSRLTGEVLFDPTEGYPRRHMY